MQRQNQKGLIIINSSQKSVGLHNKVKAIIEHGPNLSALEH